MFMETTNAMGYQALNQDPFSLEFVKTAAGLGQQGIPCLEIGAGFGVTALDALKNGAILHCNDLAAEHLEYLAEQLSDDVKKRFHPLVGDFKQCDLPSTKFGAALCCRVLHFLPGDDVETLLHKIAGSLRDDGLLFLVVETMFLANWAKFRPVFYEKKRLGLKWPGWVEKAAEYESMGYSENLSKSMHFFDIDLMVRVLAQTGFTVERISYFDRKGTFPDHLLLDGRESLGVVARKF